ncbi:uncharacterized protein SPSK_03650 [Sporothrix schenckii 1099-18]|uniref:Uncharacterized protein n=2 Tax=Sporothrix schenckii TaxID=29908 RepID=U7PRG7_SPOS1|nr:uncharacterized protein SPSK_03650 [Sporothrix schenckii 1099-18]ERS97521.1 hypothetical protein HMPREF1624_05690 [Sporothrix schenckii ATCC 58251]KJR82031.1 hypothetical protein SPSK_03650 [Sporothrix schenckii 1099-18]
MFPPESPHFRDGSGSSYGSATAADTGNANNSHTRPAVRQDPSDPLAAFERHLLAHPHRHHHHRTHGHSAHPPRARQLQGKTTFLAPPSPRMCGSHSRSRSRSCSRSPAPSQAAQHCMAATTAWTPAPDRRQSWDEQEYRRAMMVQSTGLACGCQPHAGGGDKATAPHHGHQHRHSPVGVSARSLYESDWGFSEVVHK